MPILFRSGLRLALRHHEGTERKKKMHLAGTGSIGIWRGTKISDFCRKMLIIAAPELCFVRPRRPQGNFLILIPDDIQVVSW